MNVKIIPSNLSGNITSVTSKSELHRSLICASISNKKTSLLSNPQVNQSDLQDDIKATINCLKALGAKISVGKSQINIIPIDPANVPKKVILDCGESGSTLRFILPLASVFCEEYTVIGRGRLPERPLGELLEQLKTHGLSLTGNKIPFTVQGKLIGGEFRLPGNVSSQYISGLLFALPLLDGNSRVTVTTDIESESYIKMTLNTLRKYGVMILKEGTAFYIKGGQRPTSPEFTADTKQMTDFDTGEIIDGDWSNAAFWLCAGALSNKGVSVHILNTESLQPDKIILDVLEKIGAHVISENNNITVKKNRLNNIDFDASESPDLVPVLAVLLSVCKGRSRIYNGGRLRLKESDRLKAMSENLKALGANIEETPDGLIIEGSGNLNGGTVQGFNDHRIVMAMAIASIMCKTEVYIYGGDAVNKSYVNFFEDFQHLGGKIHVI